MEHAFGTYYESINHLTKWPCLHHNLRQSHQHLKEIRESQNEHSQYWTTMGHGGNGLGSREIVTLTCGSVGLPMREEPPVICGKGLSGRYRTIRRPRSSTPGIRPGALTTAGQRAW